METIKFKIHKPLYGTFVYLYSSKVEKAIREGKMLEIEIPQGVGIVSPHDWKKNMKTIKKVFLRPDDPMLLYGNHVPIKANENNHRQS